MGTIRKYEYIFFEASIWKIYTDALAAEWKLMFANEGKLETRSNRKLK